MLINVYVASPDPDPRGEGQLPNPKSAILRQRVELVGAQPPPIPYILGERVNYLPKEWNSTLTSATKVEILTTRGEGQLPNPNEWNSTITSATREEMLTPVRIAKGGRRTGAVRIATAFLTIASKFLVNIQNISMFAI